MIIGYARVSTDDQRLDAQIDALKDAGASRNYSNKISGTKRTRPELNRLLDQPRTGDVVLLAKYDRLSPSLSARRRVRACAFEKDCKKRLASEWSQAKAVSQHIQ